MSKTIDELTDLDFFGKEDDIIETPTLKDVYQRKVRLRKYIQQLTSKFFESSYIDIFSS